MSKRAKCKKCKVNDACRNNREYCHGCIQFLIIVDAEERSLLARQPVQQELWETPKEER